MEVTTLLTAVKGEMTRQMLRAALGLRNANHFLKAYVLPEINEGWTVVDPGARLP